MAANREKGHIEEDRQVITPLYLKGYSFREIAARCAEQTGRKISHMTVREDVKHILKEFKEQRNELIEYNLTIELERISILELEYWQAWERSNSDSKKKSIKKRELADKSGFIEYNNTEVVNMGDPSYLAGVQRCIEMRCKLLGIGQPKRVDFTTNGKEFKGFSFDFLPETVVDTKPTP